MQKRRKMLTWLLTMMMALGLFGAQASIAGAAVSMDFYGYTVSPSELSASGGKVTVDVNLMNDDADGELHYRLRRQNEDKTYTMVKADETVDGACFKSNPYLPGGYSGKYGSPRSYLADYIVGEQQLYE